MHSLPNLKVVYVLVNKTNLVHNFSCMFMSILYMFRATMVPIIRRNNCINATPGICHSVWMGSHPAYQMVIHTE